MVAIVRLSPSDETLTVCEALSVFGAGFCEGGHFRALGAIVFLDNPLCNANMRMWRTKQSPIFFFH
jgi:hypothetical protein